MKIQINFDSWEELCRFLATANAQPGVPEDTRELAQLVEKAKEEPVKDIMQQAEEKLEELRAEAEAESAEKVPFEETTQEDPAATEEAPKATVEEVPAYKLADAQKAVREAVKKLGKDAVKTILSKYRATSASTLRPEDYADAIPELEAATNA